MDLGIILGQLSKFDIVEEALSVWQKLRKERVGHVTAYVAAIANSKLSRPDGRQAKQPIQLMTLLGCMVGNSRSNSEAIQL